jgi:hypothetical protein
VGGSGRSMKEEEADWDREGGGCGRGQNKIVDRLTGRISCI